MKKLFMCLCLLFLLGYAYTAHAWDHEYKGKIRPDTNTAKLLAYYVDKFTPEELTLTVAKEPDATGRYADLFMDIKGVVIERVRLDRLTFRMYDVKFNAPKNWGTGNIECENAVQIYAYSRLLEKDINAALAEQTFGGDDHWRSVKLAIAPDGLHGKGYYRAKAGFMRLDILIEIDSKLKLVNNRELWLDNPEVRVNKLDLPDYITKKALSQIQPLLSLKDFPLPMTLHNVKLARGSAELTTRKLPTPFEQGKGITYHYTK